MPPAWPRILRAGWPAWAAAIVPLWIVLILCTSWEPALRDGWHHFIWHRHYDISPDSVGAFIDESFHFHNPRLGQLYTLLAYTPGPWHSIVTPIVELSMFVLLATLALGRWPSLRRADDALVTSTIVAIVFVCSTSIGPMLVYRPYTGNYLFGFVVNLAWLVPYRLHAEQVRARRWWWIPIMLVLGAVAGLTNEHTGPAFAAAGALALAVFWRRGERLVPWALAGLVGLVAGWLVLLFAPGQNVRYGGLATKQSMLDRIVDRGLGGNGQIVILVVVFLLPAVLWIAVGAAGKVRRSGEGQPRTRALGELAGLGIALVIAMTMLASPKQGDRLYFAPICLGAAAIAAWVVAQLGRIERGIVAAGNAVVIAFVGYKLIVAYSRAHTEFVARMAIIERAAPGSAVTVPPYTNTRTRWTIADDFRFVHVRGWVASEYGLASIDLAGDDAPPLDDP